MSKMMPEDNQKREIHLKEDELGVYLESDGQILRGDFTHMIPRLKHNNLTHELLVKATRLKGIEGRRPVALDATAGMGEDSLILAASGFDVNLYERDEIIAALLKDTMDRSANIEGLSEAVGRMKLHNENSIEAMMNLDYQPDLILLDPMFPERQKSSLVKKKFQLIHLLQKPCEDEEELLKAAIAANPRRIVVKRPLKGPYLSGKKPSYSLTGKIVRYDCYVLNS